MTGLRREYQRRRVSSAPTPTSSALDRSPGAGIARLDLQNVREISARPVIVAQASTDYSPVISRVDARRMVTDEHAEFEFTNLQIGP